MIRPRLVVALFLSAALFPPPPVDAQSAPAAAPSQVLVLPFRTIGVSEMTAIVSRDLLMGDLRSLGVSVALADSPQVLLPAGPDACGEPTCAAALAGQHGATRVVYGSISQLGTKVIARLDMLRDGEAEPYYHDELTATSEEDLDRVMQRFAEGIAAGRPNSSQASVESVTQEETLTPARRASTGGFGVRAGFLFPTGNSFGGADRLTNLRGVFKYELRNWQIESSALLGFTWGKGNFDWTLLDLNVCRIFGSKDFSAYLGGGIGVHDVTVEVRRTVEVTSPYSPPEEVVHQTETAPTLDAIAGIVAWRTYDFGVVFEVRYHYVAESFDQVGGLGAQGVMVSFGTSPSRGR